MAPMKQTTEHISKGQSMTRFRHRCKPVTVYNILNRISNTRKRLLDSTGFGSFKHICKWKKIPNEFVRWVSENFEPRGCQLRLSNLEVLPITLADIEKVYLLPNLAEDGVEVQPDECPEESIIKIRKEFGLGINVSEIERVSEKDLESVIAKVKDDGSWCKAVIIYILGCLLCPDHHEGISLRYALIVDDLGMISKYQWSAYVLSHLKEGTRGYKTLKSDLHFFLIHYIERMGENSPFSKHLCTAPSLKNWDTVNELKTLDNIQKTCGFGRGIIAGYIFRPNVDIDQM